MMYIPHSAALQIVGTRASGNQPKFLLCDMLHETLANSCGLRIKDIPTCKLYLIVS